MIAAVRDGMNELHDNIMMIPRQGYSLNDLGPAVFAAGGLQWRRTDLQITSSQGYQLACSHFHVDSPHAYGQGNAHPPSTPCVVYLHGMGSNRLESFSVLHHLLKRGIGLFCFDFAGNGLSGGKYMSLGDHEELDVKLIVQHLRSCGHVSSVALWGRSMGAATAVLRAAADDQLAACILDSPFSDLPETVSELISNGSKVPKMVAKLGLFLLLRGQVKRRAGFDPFQVVPSKQAASAVVPAYFIVARDDSVVAPHHGQRLHDIWGTKSNSHGAIRREITTIPGDHNDRRPEWLLEGAAEFLEQHFKTKTSSDALPRLLGCMRPIRAATRAETYEAAWLCAAEADADKVLSQSKEATQSLGKLVAMPPPPSPLLDNSIAMGAFTGGGSLRVGAPGGSLMTNGLGGSLSIGAAKGGSSFEEWRADCGMQGGGLHTVPIVPGVPCTNSNGAAPPGSNDILNDIIPPQVQQPGRQSCNGSIKSNTDPLAATLGAVAAAPMGSPREVPGVCHMMSCPTPARGQTGITSTGNWENAAPSPQPQHGAYVQQQVVYLLPVSSSH